jgi:high-affinity Fe2+/Pb2+ permease
MPLPIEDPDSILTLIATFGLLALVLGFFLLMMWRLHRQGALDKGLVHLVFLPERRRNFLRLIALLAFFFILSGLNESLNYLGLVSELTQDVVSAIAYGGGALCLLLLIWVGLRPAEITPERRVELERSSQEMILLAFAPAEARDGHAPRS